MILTYVVVTANQYAPYSGGFVRPVEYCEYIREGESPIQTARRRAEELYPKSEILIVGLRVVEYDEDPETGNQKFVKEYRVM